MAKDMNGNPLNKGDQVLIPIGFGNGAPATIEAISSTIVTAENQQGLPQVTVALRINLMVQPNGVVPGILKLGVPPVGPPEGA
jgi:hypothetical protein